ncbi:MAG: hypothetical protein K5656_12435, partial [Lachnospiraceae bacterium]|nr:hypothetical protein [Lachnospiraceae bacterium]
MSKPKKQKSEAEILNDEYEKNYQELETSEDIIKGYEAQKTLLDKMLYADNLTIRNDLINDGGEIFTEKDREKRKLPKIRTVYYNGGVMTKQTLITTKQTDAQRDLGKRVDEDLISYVYNENCVDGDFLGLIKVYEMLGEMVYLGRVELGSTYDEIHASLDKYKNKNYNEQDLDYISKLIMKSSGSIAYTKLLHLDSMPGNLNILEVAKHRFIKPLTSRINSVPLDFTMSELFEYLCIEDKKAKDKCLEYLECEANDTVSKVTDKVFTDDFQELIAGCYIDQAINRLLNNASEKDKRAYKLASEAYEQKDDPKYPSWNKAGATSEMNPNWDEETKEVFNDLKERRRNNYIKAYDTVSKKIKITKPYGFKLPKEVSDSKALYEKKSSDYVYENYLNTFDAHNDNKYKDLINIYGPNASINLEGQSDKTKEVIKNFNDNKIAVPETMTEEMLTAIMLGAALEEVKNRTGSFKNAISITDINPARLLTARLKTKEAIDAYNQGDSAKVKDYLNHFIDYSLTNNSRKTFYENTFNDSYESFNTKEIQSVVLAYKVFDQGPLFATGEEIGAREYKFKSNAIAIESIFEAKVLKKSLLNDAAMPKNEKEETVANILADQYIAKFVDYFKDADR